MLLIHKQLFQQVIKDKVFLFLLLLLTIFTSLSFFFVIFSIDENIKILNGIKELTENQQLYKNALNSNRILAYIFWLSLISLSVFVFVMFFYRFFRTNKKQIGCIKALGFKNSSIQFFFIIFTAVVSFIGETIGLLGGYFLSDILITANSKTYNVTDLEKGISKFHLVAGFVIPTMIFCVVSLLCYSFVRNKDAGFLLAGNNLQTCFPVALKVSDKISRIAPIHKRLSLRIALRKPLCVLLLLISVMSYNVCIIIGQSLNISSAKIFDTQTTGHNYEYQIQYHKYKNDNISREMMKYISSTSTIIINDHKLERIVSGLYDINELFELKNKSNELLTPPNAGYVYISPELSEIYGVKIGDTLAVTIADTQYLFTVADIAANAQTNHIYMNGGQLTEILGITDGSYNGVFSAEKLNGDIIKSQEQRIEELNRNSVSNKTSAVINQVTGILTGIILIYLALHISFQDNVHDILILSMLGHPIEYIRQLLVNVYMPILWLIFAVTFAPSILLARTIQNSLSVSTNEYMPFGINFVVIITAFIIINLIYYVVQATFSLRIKKIMEKEEIADIIYAE